MAAQMFKTFLTVIAFVSWAAQAQTFPGSGSSGSGGDLTFPDAKPGDKIVFDPTLYQSAISPPGSTVFNFGKVTIPTGVTLLFPGAKINGPVYLLATGAVDIEGTLDISGGPGHPGGSIESMRVPSVPGPGGYGGGVGVSRVNSDSRPAQSGLGPGGGSPPYGGTNTSNQFAVPLTGGSGGAGNTGSGDGPVWPGGGAGGGAILIASDVSVTLNGTINANGGNGTATTPDPYCSGGAGGTVRLMAPRLTGTGSVSVAGGAGFWPGGNGLVRFEAYNQSLTGANYYGTPVSTYVQPFAAPSITVLSVGGILVTANPTGSYDSPDVRINSPVPVPVVVKGTNIPAGTTVHLEIYSENGPDIIADTDGLDATTMQATAMVNFPSGFSQGYVIATVQSNASNAAKALRRR